MVLENKQANGTLLLLQSDQAVNRCSVWCQDYISTVGCLFVNSSIGNPFVVGAISRKMYAFQKFELTVS